MDNTLNINQVSKVLGRSTKSVRNYIKEGKLRAEKFPSPRGLEYRFDFSDIARFAKKFLHISIEANVPSFAYQSQHAGRPNGSATGVGDLSKMLQQLEKDKTDLLKELGEMRAQAGYKIGQLESQVRLLETAKEERDSLNKRYIELEKDHTVLESEAKRLRDIKDYYDSKRWWQIWKGPYAPNISLHENSN